MDRFKSSESSLWSLHPQELQQQEKRNLPQTKLKVYAWDVPCLLYNNCTLIFNTTKSNLQQRSKVKNSDATQLSIMHCYRSTIFSTSHSDQLIVQCLLHRRIISLQIICVHYSSLVDVTDLHTEIESPIESILSE